MRKDNYNSLKIFSWAFILLVAASLILFNVACQDVTNPMGPSPEITSANNTSQATGTTSRDEFEQLKKPGTIKTPSQVKPDSPGNTETISQPSPSLPAQTKGTISPSPFPPIQTNTGRLRPFRTPIHNKKTPKTLTTPVTTSPSPSSSTDNEDEDAEKRPSQELHIQVSPDTWNFGWVNSTGLLTVRIIGEGATNVDPETLTLSLTNEDGSLTTEEIDPLWAKLNDSHILAKFKKREAIALLPEDAQAGDTFLVVINGQFQSENGNGQEFEPLTDMIRVVGQNKHYQDDEDEYLTIRLTPKNWNPAWALNLADDDDDDEGEGYVIAHFKGEGIQDIIDGSISLSLGTCDDQMGTPIAPITVELDEDEDEYLAYFDKSEAIGLIPEPKPGETYQVSVRVELDNPDLSSYCQTFTIKIVGKSHELTVKIKPDRWNISWWKTEDADNDDDDETIKVIFKGIGFDQINPASVEIAYNGSSVGGSAIVGSELDEDDYQLEVEFKRSEVIKIITDPKVGDTYTLTINFTLDGTGTSLEASISITGKIK